MKIAILTASFLPKVGGAQVFSYDLSRELHALGHEVHVYVTREDFDGLSPQFRGLLRPLPRNFYRLLRRVPFVGPYRARRYLQGRQRRENYGVWLVVVAYPSGYAASCLRAEVPIVLSTHGADVQKVPDLDYGLRLDAKIEAKVRRTVGSYNRVVVLTESMRVDLRDLGLPDEAIATIPNGVDVDWFTPKLDATSLRAELGWPNDQPVLLTTGRNHRKKGFNLIPAIAAKLRDRGFRFRWYVVGLGVDRLDEEIRSRGLATHVTTCAQIGVNASSGSEWRFPDKKMVAMYQAADIYAFPSLLEGLPLVLLEAMAAGTVVVTTDAPGCRDVVAHEENGLQARAGNIDSFSEQMSRVLEDADLRRSLSENGREFAEAHSWEHVATQYETMFRELAEGRRAGQVAPGIAGAH